MSYSIPEMARLLEDATAISTLECLRRAFEVALSYAQAKKENKELDKLQFDETLLITQEKKRPKIVDEYLKRAQTEVDKENLLKIGVTLLGGIYARLYYYR